MAYDKVKTIQKGIKGISAKRNAQKTLKGILGSVSLKMFSSNKMEFIQDLKRIGSYKGLATKLVARDRTVPQFVAKFVNKIAKKEMIPSSGIILKEGSKLSKGLTGLGGAISIGFGIFDTIRGADKIKHGSKVSDEFRKVTGALVDSKDKINKFYDVIS